MSPHDGWEIPQTCVKAIAVLPLRHDNLVLAHIECIHLPNFNPCHLLKLICLKSPFLKYSPKVYPNCHKVRLKRVGNGEPGSLKPKISRFLSCLPTTPFWVSIAEDGVPRCDTHRNHTDQGWWVVGMPGWGVGRWWGVVTKQIHEVSTSPQLLLSRAPRGHSIYVHKYICLCIMKTAT